MHMIDVLSISYYEWIRIIVSRLDRQYDTGEHCRDRNQQRNQGTTSLSGHETPEKCCPWQMSHAGQRYSAYERLFHGADRPFIRMWPCACCCNYILSILIIHDTLANQMLHRIMDVYIFYLNSILCQPAPCNKMPAMGRGCPTCSKQEKPYHTHLNTLTAVLKVAAEIPQEYATKTGSSWHAQLSLWTVRRGWSTVGWAKSSSQCLQNVQHISNVNSTLNLCVWWFVAVLAGMGTVSSTCGWVLSCKSCLLPQLSYTRHAIAHECSRKAALRSEMLQKLQENVGTRQ